MAVQLGAFLGTPLPFGLDALAAVGSRNRAAAAADAGARVCDP
jgi:hypothetical protein